MMFLTADELRHLTGYELNAYQRRWLSAHGWKFEQAATGRPVVLRSYAESRLRDQPDEARPWAPNLAVMKKVA